MNVSSAPGASGGASGPAAPFAGLMLRFPSRRPSRNGFGAVVLLALATAACASGPPGDDGPVGDELLALHAEYGRYIEAGGDVGGFQPANGSLAVSDDRVLVDATAEDDGALLLQELREVGLEGGSAYGRVVSGWLPIASIRELSRLRHLRFVRAASRGAGAGLR